MMLAGLGVLQRRRGTADPSRRMAVASYSKAPRPKGPVWRARWARAIEVARLEM